MASGEGCTVPEAGADFEGFEAASGWTKDKLERALVAVVSDGAGLVLVSLTPVM